MAHSVHHNSYHPNVVHLMGAALLLALAVAVAALTLTVHSRMEIVLELKMLASGIVAVLATSALLVLAQAARAPSVIRELLTVLLGVSTFFALGSLVSWVAIADLV